MVRKLKRDALESEARSLDALIASLDEDDDIGRASLAFRRDELIEALDRLGQEVRTTASVILSFDGGPVTGSRGIDAEFAADVLHDYQELVAKQMAASEVGGLARSGPVPAKEAAKLNVTALVHGSLGFQLEERHSDEPQLLDSAVKQSIKQIDQTIAAFSSNNLEEFNGALNLIDRRVFITLKSFFESLYGAGASLKIIEEDGNLVLDRRAVLVARDRMVGIEVDDEEIIVTGELLGLAPIQRRFDFQVATDSRVISGQVGQRLSDDYLERLHGDKRISGRQYIATMRQRTATRVDGSISFSYTLVDLVEPKVLQIG